MKIVTRFFLINFIFILRVFCSNQTIGADDAVALPQAHVQLDGGNNKIANYAMMENGFSFLDENTTCSFYSVFPVSGNVRLRGGSLNLNRDFEFSDNAKISTAGRILGDFHNFTISEDVEKLSSLMSLNYVTSIDVGTFVNSADWSLVDDGYIAAGCRGIASGPSSIKMFQLNGTTLVLKKDWYNYWNASAKCLRWRPYGSYFAVAWLFESGANIYGYAITVNYNSSTNSFFQYFKYFGINNFVDAVAWHTSGNALAVGRQDNSARVSVHEIGATGSWTLQFVNNTANSNVPTTVNVATGALDWQDHTNYLAVGFEDTGDSLQELVLYYFQQNSPFNTSTLTYTTGVNIGTDVTHLDWSPTGSFVAVAVGGSEPSLRVYEHCISNGLFEEKVDARTEFNSLINTVKWDPNGQYLSVATQDGLDEEFQVYKFDKNGYSLDLVDGFDFGWTVSGVAWAIYDDYIAVGGQEKTLEIYDFSAGRDFFVFDNVSLSLDGDFTIDVPIKFSGDCRINGGGNKLILSTYGEMVVASNSLLLLENLFLLGLKSNNLSCERNNASLIFKNLKLYLSDDFEFNSGSILFNSDVDIYGSYKFVYTSRFGSTIDSNSMLYFGNSFTFSYAPKNANKDLLYMTDKSSRLFLDGCTLLSTKTGMRLTRGTLFLDNDVTFSCDGVFTSEAICWGDGTLENDLNINFLSGTDLNIYGAFEYNN